MQMLPMRLASFSLGVNGERTFVIAAGATYTIMLLLELRVFFPIFIRSKEYPHQLPHTKTMYLNKHLIYWITRYPKTMDLALEDLMEAFKYKLPGVETEGAKFRGGFEIFIPINDVTYMNDEGIERQHYFIVTVDTIRSAIRLYIYKEEKLDVEFNKVRVPFCQLMQAIKEYVKEHRSVDKWLSKIIS
jgi:hypothetical protein